MLSKKPQGEIFTWRTSRIVANSVLGLTLDNSQYNLKIISDPEGLKPAPALSLKHFRRSALLGASNHRRIIIAIAPNEALRREKRGKRVSIYG